MRLPSGGAARHRHRGEHRHEKRQREHASRTQAVARLRRLHGKAEHRPAEDEPGAKRDRRDGEALVANRSSLVRACGREAKPGGGKDEKGGADAERRLEPPFG